MAEKAANVNPTPAGDFFLFFSVKSIFREIQRNVPNVNLKKKKITQPLPSVYVCAHT